MESPVKAIFVSVMVGIITTFVAMVLFFVPILNILVVLFPIPIAVIGVRRGIPMGMLSLVTSSVLLGVFTHPFFGIIIFCLNLFISLALMISFRKEFQMNESIILSAGGVLLSFLVSLQVFTWMSGKSFFDFLWENLRTFFSSNTEYIKRLMEFYETWGMIDKAYTTDRFIEVLMGQIKDLSPFFPTMLLITSLVLGGLSFLVSRLILKKYGSPIPEVPPFKRWALPRGTGRGFLGLMLVAALGNWIGVPNFDVVLYTVSSIFTFIFTIQGLSVATFLLGTRRIPGIFVALILVVAFMFMSVGLTFLGIIDQILGVRRAYDSRKGD